MPQQLEGRSGIGRDMWPASGKTTAKENREGKRQDGGMTSISSKKLTIPQGWVVQDRSEWDRLREAFAQKLEAIMGQR